MQQELELPNSRSVRGMPSIYMTLANLERSGSVLPGGGFNKWLSLSLSRQNAQAQFLVQHAYLTTTQPRSYTHFIPGLSFVCFLFVIFAQGVRPPFALQNNSGSSPSWRFIL